MPTVDAIAAPVATGVETTDMMKALVYLGPGRRAWQSKPRPVIRDPADAVVRITTSTICGTDLHIMNGDVPTVTAGRILGHEGIGIIDDVGPIVSTFRKRAGVDVAIEAVGLPATFDIRQSILAAGGRLANIGVHGTSVQLHLEKLWDRNVAITTRLVDTAAIPMLLKLVRSGKLQPAKLITHRFAISDIMKAYDTFGNASQERALKVILTNP